MAMPARVPAVRAVIAHEGRFLLVQHHNQLPANAGKWGLPGGRIEATDKDLIFALERELHEEFAMQINLVGFVAMYTFRDRSHHIFLATPRSLEFTIDRKEIVDTQWCTLEEVRSQHDSGRLHAGFELAAIRASLARYGGAVSGRTA
ncbi:MAG TPA: NUDIX hydrolase [Aggregatilineales bacterium]|nr:NUDIX hydrolase [Anaerolineales bacterium]HRE47580.1 NUDIX hydrolase [Aggregatilineales bacterium]